MYLLDAQRFVNFLAGGITDQRIARPDIEVNVGQGLNLAGLLNLGYQL